MFRLALICGGPSAERGISLNSARSVMDQLQPFNLEIIPIFVDQNKAFHQISSAQLYSNTPADFDYKLDRVGKRLSKTELKQLLASMDLIFPLIHGSYGEDGSLQELLEEFGVNFIGSGSQACRRLFHKQQVHLSLKKYGFCTNPQLFFKKEVCINQIKNFFDEHQLNRAIVKPAIGGSSIGVSSVTHSVEAKSCIDDLLEKNASAVVLEPFIQGTEFTIVLFQHPHYGPIALIPTEISMDYGTKEIFDYRKKYLPTNQVAYHTPPQFSVEVAEKICRQAEWLFKKFNMRDFARLDGWLVDEKIYFTDFNPISGLEQNSFLFRQAAVLGMTHSEALEVILSSACHRYQLSLPEKKQMVVEKKKNVYVLFGGENAERQVSLMSGLNVWLKLMHSKTFTPTPFLLEGEDVVWQLTYHYALHHTVEEIIENCKSLQKIHYQDFLENVCKKFNRAMPSHLPKKYSLNEFLTHANKEDAYLFIALHGGKGENGEMQTIIDRYELSYNGSKSESSARCMDKLLTGQAIKELNDDAILSLDKRSFDFSQLKCEEVTGQFWQESCQLLGSSKLLIKPRSDGCSAGVALLNSEKEFHKYGQLIAQQQRLIPSHTFVMQANPIELPPKCTQFLLEPYLETDQIFIEKNQFMHIQKSGWLELTIGVFEEAGEYRAFNPSISIASAEILSLEEKFQGGTGINLTPPPDQIISHEAIQKIKKMAARIGAALGIQNYARLDLFFNYLTEKLILIEANSLPALTPSTVIYHQALMENPPLEPLQLLEKIIHSSQKKCVQTK
jgi:D-alanine--D-alanine ligase